MSIVRRKLAKIKNTAITYGYVTKNNRIKLGIEKTHVNDAFVIAGGSTKKRVEPIEYIQTRRNNRSFEKFYDAKIIDIRSGERVSGATLDCGRRTRNKEKNGESLRIYRGEKLSKGQRRIRRQRYFYQPNDIVKFEGGNCRVIGTFIKYRNGSKQNKDRRGGILGNERIFSIK